MALSSAGVEVTIIDESQYTSGAAATIPYILMATATDKLDASGTGIAQGTLASNANDVYLVTSQRELVNTFGNPTFYKTSTGNSIHGYELNEYGLMAAYSVLGVSNRAYVQRVDVDMSELEATLIRPTGAPLNGAYWLDLAETAWGLFEWSASNNSFNVITPILITEEDELDSEIPLASIGTIGAYAVVTNRAANPTYLKNTSNEWVLVGSDDWMISLSVVVSSIAEPTLTLGNQIVINGTEVTNPGTTIDGLITAIGTANPTGVTALRLNGNLAFYIDSTATNSELILADGGVTGLLAELGIAPDTYAAPKVAQETHIQVPRWRDTDTTPRPTGSIWHKTTSVNEGIDLVVKRYNTTTDVFTQQSVPVYENDQTANKFLDPAGGGKSIAVGDTYAQYDINETDTVTLKIFTRTFGPTAITGATATPVLNTGDQYTISVSESNQTALTSPITVTVGAITTATGFVEDFAAATATIANLVKAEVTSNDSVKITHTGGGVIILEDTSGTAIATIGITASLENVRTNNAGQLVLSNWTGLVYTADSIEPGQDPITGTRWYYSDIGEIDIMIHDGSTWVGYLNGGVDTRGADLSLTNAAGPQISSLAPDFQTNGSSLEKGDLWVDTSDLENYPILRRWEADENSILGWVTIDNADQTTTNGIVFADARWAKNGTTDPITDDLPLVVDLLIEDYVDPDAPDPALYPVGTLLWNMRRSGYNVKEFRQNYFNSDDFDLTNFPSLTEANAWVTVSGLKEDGSANMGRQAQRALVVKAMKSAIDTNADIREEQRLFNLISTPGYPELIPNMVSLNNERSNTSFVVGDTPMRLANTGGDIATWASNNDGLGVSTSDGLQSNDDYMGVFYPSGLTTDLTGTSVVVPPSHMILRTIIHSDEQSYPWLAPAGIRRGVIDNVTAIGYVNDVTGEFEQMSTREGIRDVLYTNSVNPITFIPGSGIVNYGNKTTSPGSALDRINVSRLVSYIRVQLDAIGKQFVFEPNDKLTRDEIKGQIERMMNDLVAKRGLYDYVVVCDKSNNTPTRIDRNELYVDIAIEPVKAAEFIYIPVRVKNTGEISGS